MKAIIERIKDFLEDRPIASDATGMFIERDDLREIVDAAESRPTNVVFTTEKDVTFRCSTSEEERIAARYREDQAGRNYKFHQGTLGGCQCSDCLKYRTTPAEIGTRYPIACSAEEKRVKREPVSEFQSYPEHDEILRAMGIEPENPY